MVYSRLNLDFTCLTFRVSPRKHSIVFSKRNTKWIRFFFLESRVMSPWVMSNKHDESRPGPNSLFALLRLVLGQKSLFRKIFWPLCPFLETPDVRHHPVNLFCVFLFFFGKSVHNFIQSRVYITEIVVLLPKMVLLIRTVLCTVML